MQGARRGAPSGVPGITPQLQAALNRCATGAAPMFHLMSCHVSLDSSGLGGSLGGTAVWRLPLAQGMVLESRD